MKVITRQDVIDEARKYMGLPYRHMGRGGASGLDCIGLAIVVGQALEQLPEDLDTQLPAYQASSLTKLIEVFWNYVDQIPVESVLPGHGYLLSHRPNKTNPAHLAICTDYGVIQAAPLLTIPKVAEHRIDSVVESRIVAGWKFKGIIE